MIKIVVGVVLVAVVAWFAMGKMGMNKKDAEDLGSAASQFGQKTKKAADNIGMAAKIKVVLGSRKGLDAGKIDVQTEGSTVTLTGDVKSLGEREMVLNLTKNTEGVEVVVDKLNVVKELQPTATP